MWNGVLGRWLSLICLTCKHVDMNSNPRTCVEILGVATCIWNLRRWESANPQGLLLRQPTLRTSENQATERQCLKNAKVDATWGMTLTVILCPPHAHTWMNPHVHICTCVHAHTCTDTTQEKQPRCFVMFLWYRTVCAAKIKSEKF